MSSMWPHHDNGRPACSIVIQFTIHPGDGVWQEIVWDCEAPLGAPLPDAWRTSRWVAGVEQDPEWDSPPEVRVSDRAAQSECGDPDKVAHCVDRPRQQRIAVRIHMSGRHRSRLVQLCRRGDAHGPDSARALLSIPGKVAHHWVTQTTATGGLDKTTVLGRIEVPVVSAPADRVSRR